MARQLKQGELPFMAKQPNRYSQLIEKIFADHYNRGDTSVEFAREEIEQAADYLDLKLPKNLGDVIYSFRVRIPLPDSITATAEGTGKEWMIQLAGKGLYRFVLASDPQIEPNVLLGETKVPDATPGLITRYALSDEQALLAVIRYNRLIDILSGVTCYSLQSHLRTTVPDFGQIETDEVYVGVDQRGAHYVFPVEAKGKSDKLGKVQIVQGFAMCVDKFPDAICRPIGAQFMADDVVALFAFQGTPDGDVELLAERHYRLVPADEVSPEELEHYRQRPVDGLLS